MKEEEEVIHRYFCSDKSLFVDGRGNSEEKEGRS
jgi:hypothetical protein